MCRPIIDGYKLRLVFGATTCDIRKNGGPGRRGIEKTLTVYKTVDNRPSLPVKSEIPYLSSAYSRNVFIPREYVNSFETESINEDIELFHLCESKRDVIHDITNDIALIRLPKNFWSKNELDLTTNNINTICVENSKSFTSGLNGNHGYGYGAGFGYKEGNPFVENSEPDSGSDSEGEEEVIGQRLPFLSFVRFSLFASTHTTKYFNGRDVIVPRQAVNTLSALDLDGQQRDTHQVIFYQYFSEWSGLPSFRL